MDCYAKHKRVPFSPIASRPDFRREIQRTFLYGVPAAMALQDHTNWLFVIPYVSSFVNSASRIYPELDLQ